MNGKRWAALGIAAFLFFVSMGVWTAVTLFSMDTKSMIDGIFPTTDSFSEEVVEGDDLNNKIAIFDVEGTIMDTGDQTFSIFSEDNTYNHRSFLKKLEMAADSPAILKGIFSESIPRWRRV